MLIISVFIGLTILDYHGQKDCKYLFFTIIRYICKYIFSVNIISSDSRISQLFEAWIETSHDDHDDESIDIDEDEREGASVQDLSDEKDLEDNEVQEEENEVVEETSEQEDDNSTEQSDQEDDSDDDQEDDNDDNQEDDVESEESQNTESDEQAQEDEEEIYADTSEETEIEYEQGEVGDTNMIQDQTNDEFNNEINANDENVESNENEETLEKEEKVLLHLISRDKL